MGDAMPISEYLNWVGFRKIRLAAQSRILEELADRIVIAGQYEVYLIILPPK
jgi:hypothetical protein